MNKTTVISTIIGTIAGGVVGFFIGSTYSKKKAEDSANRQADEEVERMRKYYERKCGEQYQYRGAGVNRGDCKNDENAEQRNESNTSGGSDGIDYTKFYQRGGVQTDLDYEENADPTKEYDDPDEEDSEAREREEAERIAEERRLNKNRPPKVLSESELKDIPDYVKDAVLYYYHETDVLTDEDDQILGEEGEYGQFIGTTIQDSGFDRDENYRIMFVRNFELDTLYEIQKVDGDDPFTEAALGMDA